MCHRVQHQEIYKTNQSSSHVIVKCESLTNASKSYFQTFKWNIVGGGMIIN